MLCSGIRKQVRFSSKKNLSDLALEGVTDAASRTHHSSPVIILVMG